MIGFISKMFGGSKSEKDVKTIMPLVTKINESFQFFQSLSNDDLRNKTQEFRSQIKEHIKEIDAQIAETNQKAEELSFDDLVGKDAVYQEVDKLKKDRDQKIEESPERDPSRSFRGCEGNSQEVQGKFRARFSSHGT
jgi:preprotein translocase subunit SecA